jgi:hypothetical protein
MAYSPRGAFTAPSFAGVDLGTAHDKFSRTGAQARENRPIPTEMIGLWAVQVEAVCTSSGRLPGA